MEYFSVKNKDVYICFGSGIKYKWQCGGVSCRQEIIKNPVYVGRSESRIFDSSFWYSHSQFDGFVIPNFDWKIKTGMENFEKSLRNEIKRASNSTNKITFEELFLEVIEEVNKINKKITDFKLLGKHFTSYDEAYVPVSFTYQKKTKTGILIWNNCD